MPDYTFDTPQPIDIAIDSRLGDIFVDLTAGAVTTASVEPADRSDAAAQLAREATVSLVGGMLTVSVPRRRPSLWSLRPSSTVTVRVEAPAGSRIDVAGSYGDIQVDGSAASIRVRSSAGDVVLGDARDVDVLTSHGDVTIAHLDGRADVVTSNGDTRIESVGGSVAVKSGNGSITCGRLAGELRATTAHGDIRLRSVRGSAVAATSAGDISIDRAEAGVIEATTRLGDLTFGVPSSTSVWVDLRSSVGEVANQLPPVDQAQMVDKVELRGSTAFGDICVRSAR
ncbi:hypothetical protein GCM10009785_25960 [Brooklawnia cerclae]|uniref:DUF4097 and DUF4098 domain-containing protein YvlB n=1 Tax=Brooklawnia cerclae TaxID=349934 RepID=A0ABX0SGD2_9ACTN|nr:DUF4097 family beta strand repeat-containing protein [Brooklawnia cerclae]NIH57399.1 DUF4097 and DUF4098 domain-containing protein YvlB [Brooklawnia cerclae]